MHPLVLIIRDGWGHNPNAAHDAFNAIKLASTPVADRLDREWPRTLIRTSGADVGLPPGTMGNSEVGHQNIGAGRIVEQESKTITDAVSRGFHNIDVVRDGILRAKAGGKAVHLLGINSDAGVHGLLEHLFAFLRACNHLAHDRVFIHLFTDGRDTGPNTGAGFAEQVQAACREIGVGRIVTVIGRYWAMDRDHRWERVRRAFEALVRRDSGTHLPRFVDAPSAIRDYYANPTAPNLAGDEFITPRCIGVDDDGAIVDGDTVIFYNFRGDRPRELASAFVFPDQKWATVKPSPESGVRGFDRGPRPEVHFIIMTEYWTELKPFCAVAFPKPPKMRSIAGEYFSGRGLKQFRCAETEKYPHVTFFFNDYRDEPFPGERRENPQSPKVSTYDLKPEMAAYEVRDAVLRRLNAAECDDVLIVNFANGDMVGHTGNLKAAIRACEVVDECVGAIMETTLARGGSLIITADHGNAEQMWDPVNNAPHTAHTTFDVPLYVVGAEVKGRLLRSGGRLADILPTALDMLSLPKPPEMTGVSLLA